MASSRWISNAIDGDMSSNSGEDDGDDESEVMNRQDRSTDSAFSCDIPGKVCCSLSNDHTFKVMVQS